MNTKKIIGATIVIIILAGIAYFFSTSTATTTLPSYVQGEMREIYLYAQSEEGKTLLEQIPCYCGCKYEGHLHSRHCYWRDDGTFDKHGVTCAVCFDIAKKAKEMQEEGKSVCEIRNYIDDFYAPNKELATPTPMPQGCA
ncbi:MAG TPA: PCYCGC motif-containing (lipo)protein [Candidatus Nanoarchaeia archaeon]|nr:PCYCGC motif-containing (lipo)protein [Candidatus Nanoarchaeia archaeon]